VNEREPRSDVFELVKGALARGSDGVRDMPSSLLRHVPYALLYGERTGRSDGAVVKAYLERLAEAGRSAPRRLWTHYVISLEGDDLATNEIAAWLKRNRDALPERLLEFNAKYEVLDPSRSPARMASKALGGDEFATDVARVGLTLQRLRPSALMASILCGVGSTLQGGALAPLDPVGRVLALLEGHVEDAIAATQAREEVRRRALATFVEGVVSWQRRVDRHDRNPGPVLDLLTTLNQDPRFSPGRWQSIVPKPTIDIIEGWLTRHTVEAFFRVVNRLQIERQDMWDERRAFWMAYLGFVRRAWLIVGEKGVPYAHQEKIRFGRFRAGAFADHCGLVLDFGDLCAFEMNMNGRAVLWRPDQVRHDLFPKVYDETPYDRGSITRYATGIWGAGCIGIVHNGQWQRKIADAIQQHTDHGIRPQGV
jgi:hypothetical protein